MCLVGYGLLVVHAFVPYGAPPSEGYTFVPLRIFRSSQLQSQIEHAGDVRAWIEQSPDDAQHAIDAEVHSQGDLTTYTMLAQWLLLWLLIGEFLSLGQRSRSRPVAKYVWPLGKPRIFISYRRKDGDHPAGRLDAVLSKDAVLGPGRVFRDRGKLKSGDEWKRIIQENVVQANIVLVIISMGWKGESERASKSRLFDQDDWVRQEVELAIQSNKKIVPVLLDDATLPIPEDLPDTMQRLLEFQVANLRGEEWERDLDELIRSLGGKNSIAGTM